MVVKDFIFSFFLSFIVVEILRCIKNENNILIDIRREKTRKTFIVILKLLKLSYYNKVSETTKFLE